MEKYTAEIQTLSNMSDKVEGKLNRSMLRRMAVRLNDSGVKFLEQIKSECKGIGATDEDLAEEQEILREFNTAISLEKPELTAAYLKSIGREDMASW